MYNGQLNLCQGKCCTDPVLRAGRGIHVNRTALSGNKLPASANALITSLSEFYSIGLAG